MRKYKISAMLGIVLMGVSSFLACVSQTSLIVLIGNIGIMVSIGVMTYGFLHWQP
ncbi:hypothetical protein KPL42_17405 [Clostridium gasigenes]|uniref:hypothetical protein n=1 Tax=Clostridium gasigenes TaxID=94869 RepID=UPI0014384704|nr:hypothetical protein [Clostridium gasigenes]MBU3090250.1 hypothetical protein [Clostridium gasigenes]NKF05644.1 hypothetical protein [Clostridium gasigenes]QSW19083.1 hypothetical protein J1C67_16290 [Clostridium gasigenes]